MPDLITSNVMSKALRTGIVPGGTWAPWRGVSLKAHLLLPLALLRVSRT